MAFLTLIAPLIAMTYPIDKIKDGTAQAFNKWLIEYLFNAILQPLHLLIYVILVGTAVNLITINPLYALVALAFISKAEKLMKEMFGLNKAGTPPSLGGAIATGAVASHALSRLRSAGGNVANSIRTGKSGGGSQNTKVRQQSKGLETYNQSNSSIGAERGGNSNSAKSNKGKNMLMSDTNSQSSDTQGPGPVLGPSLAQGSETASSQGKSNETASSQGKSNETASSQVQSVSPRENEVMNAEQQRMRIKAPGRMQSLAKAAGKATVRGLKYTGKKVGRGALRTVASAAAIVPGAIVGGGIAIATGQARYFTAGVGAGVALGNIATNKILKAPNSIRTAYRKEKLGAEEAAKKERYDSFINDKDNIKYIKDKHKLSSDKEAKEYIKNNATDFIGAGYTDVEDVSRLMKMQEKMKDTGMTPDQIMAADQMAASSEIKNEQLMDGEKSIVLQDRMAEEIQAQSGGSMSDKQVQKHARNHMNAMRISRGLSTVSEKKEAETREKINTRKRQEETKEKERKEQLELLRQLTSGSKNEETSASKRKASRSSGSTPTRGGKSSRLSGSKTTRGRR